MVGVPSCAAIATPRAPVGARKERHVDDGQQGPGRLELVAEFVNTRDLDEDVDGLATPAELADWLTGHGLAAPGLEVRAADLRRAVELREALRAALLANNEGEPVADDALAALNRSGPARPAGRTRSAPTARRRSSRCRATSTARSRACSRSSTTPVRPAPGRASKCAAATPAGGPSTTSPRTAPGTGAAWTSAAARRRRAATGGGGKRAKLSAPRRAPATFG